MIRLTVRDLYALEDSIRASGEVNATVMPKEGFSTHTRFVAWARAIDGQEYYLALWRDSESWKNARSNRLVDIFATETEQADPAPEEDLHISPALEGKVHNYHVEIINNV